MPNNTKKIQIIFIFYFLLSLFMGFWVFIIDRSLSDNLIKIHVGLVSLFPLTLTFLFELVFPLFLKIKKYEKSFWKSLFTVFLYNSKKSEEILKKVTIKEYFKIFKIFTLIITFLLGTLIFFLIIILILKNTSVVDTIVLILAITFSSIIHIAFIVHVQNTKKMSIK